MPVTVPRQEQGIEWYLTPKSGEKRYKVRWYEDGKHKAKSFRRLSGPDGARSFYQRVRQSQEAGKRIVSAESVGLTLAEFVAQVWAPARKREVSPKSYQRDRQVYNKHILRQIGGRPIAQIDAEDLVEWQDELTKKRVGAPTQIKAIGLLNLIFQEAGRRPRKTGVTLNPVPMLKKPKVRRRRNPLVWGPAVVERVRYELLLESKRRGKTPLAARMRLQDATMVSVMTMAGLRPGEALALRWRDIEDGKLHIRRALSADEIVDRTKTDTERAVPILDPLKEDLEALRELVEGEPDDFIFRTRAGGHFVEDDWRNWRLRHFTTALERVEGDWRSWRKELPEPEEVRESVTGLSQTRPYDLGRHTHSALMLASGMRLQRLASIQGHSIRVLSETYSQIITDYEDRPNIDPVAEITKARALVWGELDPSTGEA